jgi:uncharacterized protein (TIGR03000 family)
MISFPCRPAVIIPAPKPKEKEKEKGKEEISTRAILVVTLPADAKLTVDGEATASTSSQRTFITPELQPGTEYSYVFKAESMKDGKPVVLDEKKVTFKAGETATVTLAPTASSVVSR